ncbi:hypothetical protein [Marinobacter sp. CHS3-4]|uniref:hypothetical protein n=1 Tax=Marinobacter sp. CHS3-4 TaxID=3045174 RepID=UPI0024B5CCEE|nr:hypothetical protein [Marinobacter sp. CHS3-4]MDI9246568.1 hypothetical protein [Marinobacter sp. CHS3-4]
MKNLIALLTFLVFSLALSGCATPYYGLSEKEWSKLSDEEKEAVKADYQDLMALREDQKSRDAHDARTQSIIDWANNRPIRGR